MITEDYVSFETAKLLKEKGFNEYCRAFRSPNSIGTKGLFYSQYEIKNTEVKKTLGAAIVCPTLQMAMKWLREKHNLVIQIELIDYLEHGEVWLYSVIERKTIKTLTGRDEDFTEHSYEEACEAAIKYCLENLI